MFESFESDRLLRERERWVTRRKLGKKKFLFFYTVNIANGLFCLFRAPILFHFGYGRAISHHGKIVVAEVVLPIGIAIGLWLSLMIWGRGERMMNKVDEMNGDFTS